MQIHHPALAAKRDWCPTAEPPKLLGWGISVVYTASCSAHVSLHSQRQHKSLLRSARPPSIKSRTYVSLFDMQKNVASPLLLSSAYRQGSKD